jgi:hypothetical protein
MWAVANYEALAAFLRHAGTLTLRMTFAEVEAITGKLPPSARAFRQWWGNNPSKPQAREGWLAAGYETTTVSVKAQSLEFARAARPPRSGRSDAGRIP